MIKDGPIMIIIVKEENDKKKMNDFQFHKECNISYSTLLVILIIQNILLCRYHLYTNQLYMIKCIKIEL